MINVLKKLTDSFKPEIDVFQKKEAVFITVDGKEHKNTLYNWCRISGLISRSFEKYAMIGISSDGYIKDNDGVIYPLNNVMSIRWNLVEQIDKIIAYGQQYKIWFTDEEVEKMKSV